MINQDITLGIKADLGHEITRKYIGHEGIDIPSQPANRQKSLTSVKLMAVEACKSFVEMSDGTLVDEEELDQLKQLVALISNLVELIRLDLASE